MATTVAPEDIRPGDRIEWLGTQLTVREVREDQPTATGLRVFRIMAEPDGILAATLYSGDEATLIGASTED